MLEEIQIQAFRILSGLDDKKYYPVITTVPNESILCEVIKKNVVKDKKAFSITADVVYKDSPARPNHFPIENFIEELENKVNAL